MADEPIPPKRGRPKSEEPHTSITLWLPEREADRVLRLANRHGLSASKVVLRLIGTRLERSEP